MKRKLVGLFVILAMLVGCLPNVVWADNVDNAIQQRIDDLYSKLGNTYFTVNRQACSYGAWGHGCDNCKNEYIANASWFKNMFGSCSAYNFANSYANGHNNGRVGWSCFGFANFAEWYIFKSSNSDQITTDVIGTYNFNYSNINSYAKKGDVFRLDDKHSVIFISADSSGISVLDCNWSVGSGNCKVEKHTVSYSYASTFTICRAKNRNSIVTSPPSTPTISINAGNRYTPTTISWHADNANDYYVSIRYDNNEWYTSCMNTSDTSWTHQMKPGKYKVHVEAVNDYGRTSYGYIDFTVSKSPALFTVTKSTNTATVINNTSKSQQATVIIAQYNEKVLTNKIVKNVVFDANEEKSFSHSYGSDYKIFVWDRLEGMKPLAEQ